MKRVTAHIKFNGKTIHKVRTVIDTENEADAMYKAEDFFTNKLTVDIAAIEDHEDGIKHISVIKDVVIELLSYHPDTKTNPELIYNVLLEEEKDRFIELSNDIDFGISQGITIETQKTIMKSIMKDLIDKHHPVKK